MYNFFANYKLIPTQMNDEKKVVIRIWIECEDYQIMPYAAELQPVVGALAFKLTWL